MSNSRKNQKLSFWPFSVLISLGLFVAAVLSAEIPSYGIYISLALIVLGGFVMLVSGIHKEQASRKGILIEAGQSEQDPEDIPA